jgi:hypothetical protein
MVINEARWDNALSLFSLYDLTNYNCNWATLKCNYEIHELLNIIHGQKDVCKNKRMDIKRNMCKKLEKQIKRFEAKFKELNEELEVYKLKNN